MISFFSFLYRNKLYTAIELVGFAVALAFIIFISAFVSGQLNYDSDLKNTENIYLGHGDEFCVMSGPVAGHLKEAFPEIEEHCRVFETFSLAVDMEVTVGEESFKQIALATDKNFFKLFTVPLKEGERGSALEATNSAVISESFANKYFPDESPIGKSIIITINNKHEQLMITGVMEDFEKSIFPKVDFIYPIENIGAADPNLMRDGNAKTAAFYKLVEGTDIASLEKKAYELLKEKDMLFEMNFYKSFTLTQFKKLHFGFSRQTYPFTKTVNIDFVFIFFAAGVLLLAFALLNYISLTVAQIGFRAREMATRRLVGEQSSGIVLRYIGEAFLLTAIAAVMAVILVVAFAPTAEKLIGYDVNLMDSITPAFCIVVVAALLLISVISGVIPAILVSRYKPINVIKGEFAKSNRMVLGRIFMFIQNFVAIVTLVVAFAMFLQFRHLAERDSGYNKESIISVRGFSNAGEIREDELLQLPFVEQVGHVWATPADNTKSATTLTQPDSDPVTVTVLSGDAPAFDMLGFTVKSVSGIKGENGNFPDGSWWVTESAMTALQIDYNTTLLSPWDIQICGVMQDFQKGNLSMNESSAENIVWENVEYKGDKNFNTLRVLMVKVSCDEVAALKSVEEFYKDAKDAGNLKITTLSELYREHFTEEEHYLTLIIVFTLLVVMLSSLAMLAMSTHYAKQHSRNYSIKKVFGLSNEGVFTAMVVNFLRVVALAAIAALPFAYFAVVKWLEGYEYRIDNSWWIYASAILVLALVAFVSVSYRAYTLMNSNPISELKKE